MPRPLEFDRDAAISQAMLLFLRQGYEATSIADLTRTLGISRASLYNAFGDKEGLMLETVGCAARLGDALRTQVLNQPGSARTIIERFFRGIANRDHPGCYFLTLGSEIGNQNPKVSRRVKAALDSSRQLFRDLLSREQRFSPAEVEAKSAALLAAMVSLLMLARLYPQTELLTHVLQQSLTVLD